MESGTLHAVAAPQPPASGDLTIPAPGSASDYLSAPGSPREQPVAVVVAGAAASGTGALVAALLGEAEARIEPPAGSYLVIRYGECEQLSAYVPGCRDAQPFGPVPPGPDSATDSDARRAATELTRPPRRVELEIPHTLLRSFTLITAPCVRQLGVAGGRILADVAERGGAVVFVAPPDRPLDTAELDVLAELATRQVAVFFAVTPARGGTETGDGTAMLDRHRAALAARVPCLAAAPWLAVDPAAGDITFLRRSLIEWAGVEGLHRAGEGPTAAGGSPGTVRVAADAADSGWPATLDGWLRTTTRQVRQRLTTELANIHLRCVQEILFGGGPAGLPEALDRELHALSLRATAECDAAMAAAVDRTLRRVAAGEPTDGVRHRMSVALRQGLADDPANPDFTRVLLVTRTCGVATIAGEEAVAALPAYRTDRTAVLPPVAIGLSGGCYLLWRQPAPEPQPAAADGQSATPADDTGDDGGDGKARSWLQRVIRAVEQELLAETDRRFEAVHRSLAALITESVDHGILLV